jgi:DNA replication and repair protein RecF
MWLKKLALFQFKNYQEATLSFVSGVNCLTGRNGAGKTNILDAIHYLCFTRSFFNPTDAQNIKTGEEMMLIQGWFSKAEQEQQISIGVKRNLRKSVKCNGNEYDKLSKHIGLYPLVIIVPGDINYIYEGSEERRRGMDLVISQVDREYLLHLAIYHKALEQRNRQLKLFNEGQPFDRELLALWEASLIKSARYIFEQRKKYIDKINVLFAEFYQKISSGNEGVQLVHQSQLYENELGQLFETNLQKDLILQRTSAGIHKDDLDLLIDFLPLKKFGSQGQQKSYIISLRLAEYQYLNQLLSHKPLLLLDDIFEKIDNERAHSLLRLLGNGQFGQIFITDTHLPRLQKAFSDSGNEVRFFEIDHGNIIPLNL